MVAVCALMAVQAQIPFVKGKAVDHRLTEMVMDADSVELGFAADRLMAAKGDVQVAFGRVVLLEAQGWLESACVKFGLYPCAVGYHVYAEADGQAPRLIDGQLVRNYGSYGRADIVGLAPGDYRVRVVPVDSAGNEVTQAAAVTEPLTVCAYNREGFAHHGNTDGVGAYRNDGTLKDDAVVVYVTSQTAKTVTARLNGSTYTGMQAILAAYEKGNITQPLSLRIIGTIRAEDVDAFGSSSEGIQIKGRKADSPLNITVEGIGDDATVYGFGFLVRNTASLEMRNLGIMQCMDDGISLDTDNSHVWIHHIDVFYGRNKGGDQKKGDGAIDVKSDSKFVTIDNCHFWDTGKSSLCGMKSESGPNYITYHHNWFDHSDSRHARVRTMSVHLYNNYFDQVAKYGVGATSASSVFVEANYFLRTKKPILSSGQGTDAQGSGTFSGEDGGLIKAYANHFDRTIKNFKYLTQQAPAATGYDAYEVQSRNDQVPATEVTRVGATAYNNFDTDAQLMYAYTPDAAADVPAVVTGVYGAGRMNHGDFSYSFADNIGDDTADSEIDSRLEALIKNYTSSLIGIFGAAVEQTDTTGQGEQQPVEGTILCTFDKNGTPSSSLFTVVGNGSGSKGEATVDGQTLTTCLKMESSTSIRFTLGSTMKMTLYFGDTETASIKINGRKINGTSSTYSEILPADDYELTKDKSVNLFAIKLEPQDS